MVRNSYDWDIIKNNCSNFIVLNSDNDPWGCDDKVGMELSEHLDGKFILMKDQGHM